MMVGHLACCFGEQFSQASRSKNRGRAAKREKPEGQAIPFGSCKGEDRAVFNLLLFNYTEPPLAFCAVGGPWVESDPRCKGGGRGDATNEVGEAEILARLEGFAKRDDGCHTICSEVAIVFAGAAPCNEMPALRV